VNGLSPALEVDDAQSSVSEAEWTVLMEARAVGAAVLDLAQHAAQQRGVGAALGVEIEDAS
jgi:hypothetical protein